MAQDDFVDDEEFIGDNGEIKDVLGGEQEEEMFFCEIISLSCTTKGVFVQTLLFFSLHWHLLHSSCFDCFFLEFFLVLHLLMQAPIFKTLGFEFERVYYQMLSDITTIYIKR